MRFAQKIFALNSFRRQYRSIQVLSVCNTLVGIKWEEEKEKLLSQIDWNNMLSIASILSYSDDIEHLDAGLRIAQTCLTQESTNVTQKQACVVILESLANKQAIMLAVTRDLLSKTYQNDLPPTIRLDIIKNNLSNSILINDSILYVNKFQKAVYETQKENTSISISAPTSAGKSFILSQIILEEILANSITVVYIVPTRALISQVESDFRKLFSDHRISNVNLSSVPSSQPEPGIGNIFVFTQERLHWFLTYNDLKIDMLIVDEAQKIDDSNRGILLQQKIEEVLHKNRNARIFFSSPFTSNPEILLDDITEQKKEVVDTQVVSVNQNLIYLSQTPKKVKNWEMSLCLKTESIKLGTIEFNERLGTTDFEKISKLAIHLSGGNGGNLVYSNGAAESEKIGLLLYSYLPNQKPSKKLKELIKLVKKTIHRKYALAVVLEKGIAFHYGNIPLLIRLEIENLFKEGIIKFLICTSTLLEGVNLPAKNIFIRKPTRGRAKPLNENDFWNLAGRAGRLGKEMSGNIICFEPNDWEYKPSPNRKRQSIKRAIDQILGHRADELIQYIQNGSPRELAEQNQDLEFAFGYLYLRFLNDELPQNTPIYSRLNIVFKEISGSIKLPYYIIKRNPGISPIAQQELLDYFIKKSEYETLLPVYPEDSKAEQHYTELIGRIGKTIANYPYQLNMARSILVLNWLRGLPLSVLIDRTFKFYQKSEKYRSQKNLPAVIREVMESVENFVRFRFAKDTSCYIDILRYFLEINNRADLKEQIPDLTLWLEFGVNQKTHLSLLSLGLSRNSVIEIAQFLPSPEMSLKECSNWLLKNSLEEYQLSTIVMSDIQKIKEDISRKTQILK